MRNGPSMTSRRPLTHPSLAEAFRFRHYDVLTIDPSVEKLSYPRARTVTIGKQLKSPQLLVRRVVWRANIEPKPGSISEVKRAWTRSSRVENR
jgi:hypothetical protein